MKSKVTQKLILLSAFILLLSMNAFSQTPKDDKNVLPPPLEGLVAVHHPELKGLEKDVSEQIISFQETLLEATKTTPTTREKLSDSYGTMGEIYHAYSLLEPAKESYINASRLSPKNFKWLHLLGKLSFQQNDYYDAIDYFKKSQNLRPDYLPTYINIGNTYLELDLLDIAKENFDQALKISKDNPAALYGLGQIEYSKRNFAGAVKYFEQVLKILPDANRVHYSLAIAYRGLNNIEKAKFHLSKQGTVGVRVFDPIYESLSELKQGTRLRILRGKQAFEAERFSEAQIEFQKVLEAEPKNITALVNLGSTYVKLGKGSEAVKLFEEALRVQPLNINARYNLAVLLALQQKHFQAIAHLKEILKVSPNDMDARFLLAKELRNANLLQESLSEIAVVFQANTDNEEVLIEVVKILSQKGDDKQAIDILNKSLQKFPERGRTMAMLAYLLATAPDKDLRDGQRALEISTKVYNTTKLIQHGSLVALAYAELGKCAEAAKLTEQLIEAAAKAKSQNLVDNLKIELERYQNETTCKEKN